MLNKRRVSIMIDKEDDDYILERCSQHGDKSRFFNVALKNLISAMKQSLKYHLPKLNETISFKDFSNIMKGFLMFFVDCFL